MRTFHNSPEPGNLCGSARNADSLRQGRIHPAFDSHCEEPRTAICRTPHFSIPRPELTEAGMHTLLLVTLSMPKDSTSKAVRSEVYSPQCRQQLLRRRRPVRIALVRLVRYRRPLERNPTHSFWASPIRMPLNRNIPNSPRATFLRASIHRHKHGLSRLWHRFGAAGDHPLLASGYDELGAEDDAMRSRPLTLRLLPEGQCRRRRKHRGSQDHGFCRPG